MSKIRVKTDSTLDISIEERLFENIRKVHTWYTGKWAYIILGICVIIDLAGFRQIVKATINEDVVSRNMIIAGLAVAFEIAPLYIGYSLCLKCYKLGRRIHNWVLLFSTSACILGILGNICYRLKTINIVYLEPGMDTVSPVGLPVTILMCMLPVITSLVNLVIGCLLFNPLEFDLLRLAKKRRRLKCCRQQIKADLEEFKNEEALRESLENAETICYENVKRKICALQTTLKTYAVIKTSNLYELQNKDYGGLL